jgi:hypothetical protein
VNVSKGFSPAVPPAPTFAPRGLPRSAGDAFGDPGFQRLDVAGESAAAHQADAEDVGIEQQAARLRFLFLDAAWPQTSRYTGFATFDIVSFLNETTPCSKFVIT